MPKSNREKAMGKMKAALSYPAIAIQEPKSQKYSIEIEKKMVDGKLILVGCIEDYNARYLSPEGNAKEPMEQEYTSMDAFKTAISETVDKMIKKVK